jgi:RNA polymerase sigma-70 factor (ECF subfamily)
MGGDGAVGDGSVTGRGRSDAALVRAARSGSEAALDCLFQRHWRHAYHTAYLVCHDPAAAEDIAQEAFVAAVRSLERFDRRRPFGPWLRRIVVNRAIDWTRMRAARRESPTEHLPELAAPCDQPASGDDDDGGLGVALGRLAPDQRAVIVLRYVLDLTPGEIAQTLDLPRGTVNSRLRRGLDQMRAHMDQDAGR